MAYQSPGCKSFSAQRGVFSDGGTCTSGMGTSGKNVLLAEAPLGAYRSTWAVRHRHDLLWNVALLGATGWVGQMEKAYLVYCHAVRGMVWKLPLLFSCVFPAGATTEKAIITVEISPFHSLTVRGRNGSRVLVPVNLVHGFLAANRLRTSDGS